MENTIIRLCYRKIIDSRSQKAWDKFVFEDSFTEFLLQAQYFDREQQYSSFHELVKQVPDAARLHFLVSPSVTGYIQQLKGIVPGIVNVMDKPFLAFSDFRFEIINSDSKNKLTHCVAINFYSLPLWWHTTIDKQLLVSAYSNNAGKNEEILTELFTMQPGLGIYSIKKNYDDQSIQSKNISL